GTASMDARRPRRIARARRDREGLRRCACRRVESGHRRVQERLRERTRRRRGRVISMANTIDIRRRIRSVKNTQQITKAMKMVAAAKLRRAQERMFAARPYSAALRQVLSSVA